MAPSEEKHRLDSDRSHLQNSHLPPEIWCMIIELLLLNSSPRKLASLALVSRLLYQLLNPLIYRSIVLHNNEENALLVRTLKEHPDLRALIREFRHDENTGFRILDDRSHELYGILLELPALKSLVMRMRSSQLPPGDPLLDSPPARGDWNAHKFLDYRLSGVGKKIRTTKLMDFSNNHGPCGYRTARDPFRNSSFLDHPGFKALRSCHIGSDYLAEWGQEGDVWFNESIFWLPHLERLCVTNCQMKLRGNFQAPDFSTTELKDLTLLNCDFSPADLARVLRFPKALKKLTWRCPAITTILRRDGGDFSFPEAAIDNSRQPLESLDIDVYYGGQGFVSFSNTLKHLTITPDTAAGFNGTGQDFMVSGIPPSLETLTIRHQEEQPQFVIPYVRNMLEAGRLPSLRKFTYQVPEIMRQDCMQIPAFGDYNGEFQSYGVEFSIFTVPYPLSIPSYQVCSCEHLESYHRFPIHDPEIHNVEEHLVESENESDSDCGLTRLRDDPDSEWGLGSLRDPLATFVDNLDGLRV